MAQLARILPAVAVACPNCQARLSNLPLDTLAAGVGHDCPHCGQSLRISPQVLARLIAQRDAAQPSDFPDEDEPTAGTVLSRIWDSVVDFFKKLLD